MLIRILGTAGAAGCPKLFCGCDTCKRARATGGKNIRSRASVQIDDHYKIDLPPDCHWQCVRFGIDLSELKCLLFTHSHADHFAAMELQYLQQEFARDLKYAPIRIYAPEKVVSAVESLPHFRDLPIELHKAEPFVPIEVDHLTFTPILAGHIEGELCLNYLIGSGDAAALYACDTGAYGPATMEFLRKCRIDALIVECTYGTKHVPCDSHMTLSGVVELRDDLAKAGALDSNARCVITHFSHNGGLLHDELQEIVRGECIEVAYDGMVLTLD